jgi:aspartate aminotransferase
MAISKQIKEYMASSSFIRKMFEEGRLLKEQHGADRVFDFTIGNPSLEPPPAFTESIIKVAREKIPGKHSYMPNGGYPYVRARVAERVSLEQKSSLGEEHILMTCGAGGALNVALKTIINPGDTVLAMIPYFVEYKFYVSNHGGEIRFVPTKKDFHLDLTAIEKAVDSSTAAVIINSPNNPSGVVYPQKDIAALGELLDKKSRETGRVIYLLSDEPYRKIVFDGLEVPPVFPSYRNSIIATSCSKDLSIPGERIGWLAIHPEAEYLQDLINGMTFCNRTLGFVNAPALMQRILAEVIDESADMEAYQRKKDLLCGGLADSGYAFVEPQGTFYLFAQAPGGDDMAFINALKEELILAVPGSGFGMPGYFRLAFCVPDKRISDSMAAFDRTIKRFS